MKRIGKAPAVPPALAPSGAFNMSRFAETSPPGAAALDMSRFEDADMPADVPEPEEPGLLEAAGRGLKQGVTFGFGDEISGALESAFTNKTYRQARDEARAADKRAQEAHPWGYGLSQAIGGVATGLATGGAAGAAAKLGTMGVAGLAGAEGALGAAGDSEADLTKGDVGGLIKDTAVGGATGAVIGAGLHKVLGQYVGNAVERRAQHLTEDIGEGAIPTVKRRLGKVTGPDAEGNSLAVEVLDQDPEFLKALKAGKKEALGVAQERLDTLAGENAPAYKAIDSATGGVRFGDAKAALQSAINEADVPGNSNVRDALVGTLKDLEDSTRRKLEREGATEGAAVHSIFERQAVNDTGMRSAAQQTVSLRPRGKAPAPPVESLDDHMLPTQDVRDWVTKLLKRADQSMGSLSETERKVVKDHVHEVAHDFLRGSLEQAAQDPALAPAVETILGNNRKIRLYASVKEALAKAQERKNWGASSLRDVLSNAGLPGVAAVVAGGADVASGGLAFGGAKLAQAVGKKLNRGATYQLARLVRASRAGEATAAMGLEAVKAGVPTATVNGILGGARAATDGQSDLGEELSQ